MIKYAYYFIEASAKETLAYIHSHTRNEAACQQRMFKHTIFSQYQRVYIFASTLSVVLVSDNIVIAR